MSAELDAIMRIMDAAFDPAFGEAWNRRQIGDALARRDTRCLLDSSPGVAQGFALSRHVFDEEELLLIAVCPHARRHGVATKLLEELCVNARGRGAQRLFLEMRDGNPASAFYDKFGFQQIGLRPGYYRGGANGPIDALTLALML